MPTSTQYRYHPAYQEGRNAYAEGTRRGHNPYAATGHDQSATYAWWQGWDDEQEIIEDEKIFLYYVPLPIFDDGDDGEPDFTLDDLEWSENYPELDDCDWEDE